MHVQFSLTSYLIDIWNIWRKILPREEHTHHNYYLIFIYLLLLEYSKVCSIFHVNLKILTTDKNVIYNRIMLNK